MAMPLTFLASCSRTMRVWSSTPLGGMTTSTLTLIFGSAAASRAPFSAIFQKLAMPLVTYATVGLDASPPRLQPAAKRNDAATRLQTRDFMERAPRGSCLYRRETYPKPGVEQEARTSKAAKNLVAANSKDAGSRVRLPARRLLRRAPRR